MYQYEWLDKVTQITEGGKVIRSFRYHTGDQLTAVYDCSSTESFLWDGLALIHRGGTSYINEPYVTGGNPILADNRILFNDMLGSTLGSHSDEGYTPVRMTAFGETEDESAMFTGKPYIGELGYAFLFRNYRPEQGKWQTTDPLGYPDGWNNFAYCNNQSTLGFDKAGLSLGYYYYVAGVYYYTANDIFAPGIAQDSINSFQDALNHYRSGAGGIVPAGSGLISEMTSASSYTDMIQSLQNGIENKLIAVAKSDSSGTVSNAPDSYRGLESYPTMGSYRLDINYNAHWTASSWTKDSEGKYYRTISSSFTVFFSGSNGWDFHWNPEYPFIKNVCDELLPGYIAGSVGNPKDYTITYSMTHDYNLQVRQYE